MPLPSNPNVTTVHLGRYTREHANTIAERLDKAEIIWWYKDSGFLSSLWEMSSVRIFVDKDRLGEAKQISAEVLAADGIPPDAADPGSLLKP